MFSVFSNWFVLEFQFWYGLCLGRTFFLRAGVIGDVTFA